MSDSQVIECASSCTVTVQHEIVLPVLNLTPYEGGVIAGAVLAVWAVGFVFRALIRLLRDTDNKGTYED